jgi:hypothetical protein
MALRDGIAVPRELIDLLLQIALKTDTGAALMAGYRLGNPAIGLHLGAASLAVQCDGLLRLVSIPAEYDAG